MKPDAVYTITGERFRGARVLANDTEEPWMPEEFHRLIATKAMLYYAETFNDQARYSTASVSYAQGLGALEKSQYMSPRVVARVP